MQPGTVVSVVNSYAATSEYTPARFVSRVDFPTDGNPTTENTYARQLQIYAVYCFYKIAI